jgi:hypothetical protein
MLKLDKKELQGLKRRSIVMEVMDKNAMKPN